MIPSSRNAWNSTFLNAYAAGTLFRYFLGVCFVECSISKIDQFVVSSLAKNVRLGLSGMRCRLLHFETKQETISQKCVVTCLLHGASNELEFSLLRIAQFFFGEYLKTIFRFFRSVESRILGSTQPCNWSEKLFESNKVFIQLSSLIMFQVVRAPSVPPLFL